MSNPPEPSKALQETVDALLAEARAAYAAQGIPAQEVTTEALAAHMGDQMSEADLLALLGYSREQLTQEAQLALVLNLAEDLQAAGRLKRDKPIAFGPDADPRSIERVRWFQRAFREQEAKRAFWEEDAEQDDNSE